MYGDLWELLPLRIYKVSYWKIDQREITMGHVVRLLLCPLFPLFDCLSQYEPRKITLEFLFLWYFIGLFSEIAPKLLSTFSVPVLRQLQQTELLTVVQSNLSNHPKSVS